LGATLGETPAFSSLAMNRARKAGELTGVEAGSFPAGAGPAVVVVVLGVLGVAGVLGAAGGCAVVLLLLELPQPAAAIAAMLKNRPRCRVRNLFMQSSPSMV
jgi:hypothetical protein